MMFDQDPLPVLDVFFPVFTVRSFVEWKKERQEVKDEEDQEEDQEVFTVELHRGPHGLGLALVDGMVRR